MPEEVDPIDKTQLTNQNLQLARSVRLARRGLTCHHESNIRKSRCECLCGPQEHLVALPRIEAPDEEHERLWPARCLWHVLDTVVQHCHGRPMMSTGRGEMAGHRLGHGDNLVGRTWYQDEQPSEDPWSRDDLVDMCDASRSPRATDDRSNHEGAGVDVDDVRLNLDGGRPDRSTSLHEGRKHPRCPPEGEALASCHRQLGSLDGNAVLGESMGQPSRSGVVRQEHGDPVTRVTPGKCDAKQDAVRAIGVIGRVQEE